MINVIKMLIIVAISTTICHGQVPGYMGKRMYATIDFNPTPAVFCMNVNNKVSYPSDMARAESFSFSAMNYRPQVNIEYLIKRDIAFGLSYSKIQTGTKRTNPDDTDNYDVVKGQSVGINFRFFRMKKSGSIAPIGMFTNLSLEYSITNSYDDKSSKERLFLNDFTYPVFTYGWGKQSVLAQRFIFRYGIELGYAIVPGNYMLDDREWTVQEDAGYNVHGSLLGYYLFSFKLALGSLLF